MKIGVLVDCMKLDVKKGVFKARELGFDGIQVYATHGELAPENLSESGREQFRDFVAAMGLELAALVGDVGGFDDPVTVEQRVERSKQILRLAEDLHTPVVSAHIGLVEPEKASPQRACVAEALEELGAFCENVGVFFAAETGMEPATVLKDLLDSLKTDSIKVNYDPANLVMVAADDPIAGVNTLAKYIVHVHAKDGKKKGTWSPAELHATVLERVADSIRFDEWFVETPLGDGDVNLPRFIEALTQIGYGGFLTIERETGENPIEDIRAARGKIRETLLQIGE
jgi:sugar phosphate isomerase/epimerase